MRASPAGYAVLAISVSAGACLFDDQPPPGAVIVCVGDGDCPAALRCNTDVHECLAEGSAPDVAAPALIDVTLDPAAVNDGLVELAMVADEALAQAPLLAWDGTDPGFVLAALDGATARFSVDATALAPGAYPLRSVELVDAQGNRAVRPTPDIALVVDRTAPRVLGVNVAHAVPDAANAGLPFSANPGTNAIAVSFAVDEAVADDDVSVTVGTLTTGDGEGGVSCVRGAANTFSCAATVDALAFTDELDDVIVRVEDAAGNVGELNAQFATDLSGPALLEASVSFTKPGSAQPIASAVTGGGLVVDIVSDEDLDADAPPQLIVTGDITLGEVTVTSTTPLRWRVVAQIDEVGAGPFSDTANAALVVADLVGNVNIIELDEIPLGIAIGSQCTRPNADACVDFDGDGDALLSADCPAGADCDDTDPLTRSGVLDIPGDGIDNDCAGDGDLPIDESVGVFVNTDALIDGDGTRAAPTASFTSALPLLAGRRWLFLAASPNEYATGGTWNGVSLVGNLSPADWTRLDDGGRSRVQLSAPLQGDVVVFDDITFQSTQLPHPVDARLSLRNSRTTDALLELRDRFVAVDSRLGAFDIAGSAIGSVVVRSELFDEVNVGTGRDLVIINCTSDDYLTVSGNHIGAGVNASLVIVNSAVGDLRCESCARLDVLHSLVVADVADGVLIGGNAGSRRIFNSILRTVGGPPDSFVLTATAGTNLDLGNNLFDNGAIDAFLAVGAVLSETLDDLNACDTPGFAEDCERSVDNILGPSQLAADGLHLESNSPAIDAGALFNDVHDAIAADFDGNCRFGDGNPGPDIGLDER